MSSPSQIPSLRNPVPTPPAVRLLSSLLMGLGVAVLATTVPRGVQVAVLVVAVGASLLLIFAHPYRREVRRYLEERGYDYKPRFRQVVPLLMIWLALMLTPAFAPFPVWGVVIEFLVIAGWMYLMFPHIDGTRPLAYIQDEPVTKPR